MGSPGQRPQGQPGRRPAGGLDDAVQRGGAFARLLVRHHALATRPRTLAQRQIDPPFLHCRCANHQGPVYLAHIAVPERLAERGRRTCAPRQQQNSAGVAVQPVNQPRAFPRAESQRVQHGVEMARGFRTALDRDSGRLVQGNHFVVPINHQRLDEGGIPGTRPFAFVARRPHRNGAGLRRNANSLAHGQPDIRFRPLAVDSDLPGPQKLLQHPVCQPRIVPPEPAVEPDIVVVHGNTGDVDAAHTAMARTSARPAKRPPTASTTDEAA